MSIQAVAWALEQEAPPARAKLVLVSICNHASHVDGYCWLKAETIAKEASCSPRAVYNFVGDLVRNGFLRREPRKGDDGKQRANDYWVLFHREDAEWIGDRPKVGDGEAEPQDVVVGEDEPDAPRAYGESEAPPVEIPVGAVGPHAPACRRYNAEPSKIKPNANPLETQIVAPGRPGGVPRHYRPPPPQPIAEVHEQNPDPMKFFVIAGTPAYEAWARYKAKKAGLTRWNQTMMRASDGKWGWYFPSLFPPGSAFATLPTGPPATPADALTDEELNELARG